MTKRMLINATQKEEMRIALVNGQWLYDLDIERTGKEQKKANIYAARITRVEPSLEAVFVDYGAERHGFLPFREIAREYLDIDEDVSISKINIREKIYEGKKIIVQIDKEERGNKGAALTTFISLAGCYLVLMPNNPRAGGISRRIEGDERDALKEAMSSLNVPEGMGIIVRTAGVGRSTQDLKWDLQVLLEQWERIKEYSKQQKQPTLIYKESDIITRAIRDYLKPDIQEILIDNETVYQSTSKMINMLRPDFSRKVKLYKNKIPLFNRFQIESQIESAYRREVILPSGGAIVIDHTEALVSIDINSARATKGSDIEETALQTNLEAAHELARQLRLRDIGGLVVIDFIDMAQIKNQRAVERCLKEALSMDRARVQVGKISRFGLLEMSRQRLKSSLGEATHVSCPKCTGQGTVPSIETLTLTILRIIEENSIKPDTAYIQAQMPIEIATLLTNEKRDYLQRIEKHQNVKITIIPNKLLETPKYFIERFRKDSIDIEKIAPSYTLVTKPIDENQTQSYEVITQDPEPTALTPVNKPTEAPKSKGLLHKIWSNLFSFSNEEISSEENSIENKSNNNNKQFSREDKNRKKKEHNRRRKSNKHSNDDEESNFNKQSRRNKQKSSKNKNEDNKKSNFRNDRELNAQNSKENHQNRHNNNNSMNNKSENNFKQNNHNENNSKQDNRNFNKNENSFKQDNRNFNKNENNFKQDNRNFNKNENNSKEDDIIIDIRGNRQEKGSSEDIIIKTYEKDRNSSHNNRRNRENHKRNRNENRDEISIELENLEDNTSNDNETIILGYEKEPKKNNKQREFSFEEPVEITKNNPLIQGDTVIQPEVKKETVKTEEKIEKHISNEEKYKDDIKKEVSTPKPVEEAKTEKKENEKESQSENNNVNVKTEAQKPMDDNERYLANILRNNKVKTEINNDN